MIPTLEDLRKSLLQTPEVSLGQPPAKDKFHQPPAKDKFQTTSSRASKSVLANRPDRRQPPTAPPIHHPFAQLLEDDPFADLRADLEQTTADIENAREDVRASQPPSDVAQAVALVFGSPSKYEEHLALLAEASKSMQRVNRIAGQVFEPLKIFRDRVQQLRVSYEASAPNEPESVFRRRLARMLPPDKPIQTFDRTAVTFGNHLFALSKSLECAKALHEHLVSLARTFDAARALEVELERLARSVDQQRP